MESHPSAVRTPAYRFGEFTLDGAERLLSRGGTPVPLPARAFDSLLFLVENAGRLVTKNELLDAVWANAFVEESNLTVAISTLRRALGEDPADRKYIQTVSGRGYRFVASVEVIEAPRPRPGEHEASISPEPITVSAATPPAAAVPATEISARSGRAPGLRFFWPALAVAALLFAVIAWAVHQHTQNSFRIRSLAILPIKGTEADDYILLGLTDSLIGEVGNSVAVRPMSSVFRYTAAPADPGTVGREQGADAVVLGSLHRAGNDTTVDLTLYRTSNGKALWSQSFTEKSADTQRLQQTMTRSLSAEIARFVEGGKPAAAAPKPAVNEQAYQLYLRGRYFWNRRTDDALHHSIESYRQAIAIDPNYAPAYAGLADSYALLASFSVESGRAATPDARSAALSAIQLDPALAEPHASLGMIYFFTDWDGPAAETEFERSISLNPNYATAHHWYALDLAAMGRFPEARYEIRRAQSLDPLSLIIGTNVGWIDYLNHDYDGAIAAYRKVLELDPTFARALTRLGIAEIRKGDYAAAINDLTSADKLSNDPYITGLLGQAQALGGHTATAQKTLQDLKKRASTKYVPPFSFALIYMGLGQKDAALAALKESIDDRSTPMVYAKIDPSLDEFRKDPAFQKLIAGMKF